MLRAIDEYLKDFPRSAEVEGFRWTAEEVARVGAEDRLYAEIAEDARSLQSDCADEGLAKRLLEKCESFLKDLPASRHMAAVRHITTEALAAMLAHDRARAHAALRVHLNTSAGDPSRCHELCAEFLEKDPSHPKADEMRGTLDGYLRLADDRSWNGVTAFALKYPDLFPEQIEKVDTHLAHALFTAH